MFHQSSAPDYECGRSYLPGDPMETRLAGPKRLACGCQLTVKRETDN